MLCRDEELVTYYDRVQQTRQPVCARLQPSKYLLICLWQTQSVRVEAAAVKGAWMLSESRPGNNQTLNKHDKGPNLDFSGLDPLHKVKQREPDGWKRTRTGRGTVAGGRRPQRR